MLGMQVILVLQDVWGGPPREVRFPDPGPDGGTVRLTIGRSADCDLCLDDPGRTLSRRHLELERGVDGMTATDVSLMGSWLGGARMPADIPMPVDHADVIMFSHFRLGLRIEARGEAAESDSVDAILAGVKGAAPDAARPAQPGPAAEPARSGPEASAEPAPSGAPEEPPPDDAPPDLGALLDKPFISRGD